MEVRYLRQLVEVIEYGSISAAAEALSMTQSTLSRNMKSLEASVGAPILRRERYGVKPTEIGQALGHAGETIREALIHAEAELSRWRKGFNRHIRIGASPMIANSIIPSFLNQAASSNRNLVFEIVVGFAAELMRQLKDGNVDIVIARADDRLMREGLTRQVLFRDRLGVYSSETHPLARSKGITEAELSSANWIAYGGAGKNGFASAAFQALKIEPSQTQIVVANDLLLLLSLVTSSNYVVALPELLTANLGAPIALRKLRLEETLPSHAIAMWCRTEQKSLPIFGKIRGNLLRAIKLLKAQ